MLAVCATLDRQPLRCWSWGCGTPSPPTAPSAARCRLGPPTAWAAPALSAAPWPPGTCWTPSPRGSTPANGREQTSRQRPTTTETINNTLGECIRKHAAGEESRNGAQSSSSAVNSFGDRGQHSEHVRTQGTCPSNMAVAPTQTRTAISSVPCSDVQNAGRLSYGTSRP